VGVICIKGKREQMQKHIVNLVMIQWNCVLNKKQEWKLAIELKILKLCKTCVFITYIIIFMEHFLSRVFYVWVCTYFFFFHCGLKSFKVLHNIRSLHCMCIIWKLKTEKNNEPKKERCIILLNILVFFLLGKKLFGCVFRSFN
jgi:hypothetical protein